METRNPIELLPPPIENAAIDRDNDFQKMLKCSKLWNSARFKWLCRKKID